MPDKLMIEDRFVIMAVRQPRYNKEEFAQRGDLIYQTQIRRQVEAGNHGKTVAIDIDIETGDRPNYNHFLASKKYHLIFHALSI
jgi:hypothetical protein